MGQSSLGPMGVYPSFGLPVLLSLRYRYNPVEAGSVAWLQNFLWIKKWPFCFGGILWRRHEKEDLL